MNITGEDSYQNVLLLIDAYEKAALASSRTAIATVALGPLYQMKQSLTQSKEVVTKLATAIPAKVSDIPLDDDLKSIFEGNSVSLSTYLEECLSCSIRPKFDYEIKSLDILASIDRFADVAFDTAFNFDLRLKPSSGYSDLCELLNAFKTFCLQDIMLLVLSIKFNIKQLISSQLKIKADWSFFVGGLLKGLLDSVGEMIDSFYLMIGAPLNCSIAELMSKKLILDAKNTFSEKSKLAITPSTKIEDVLNSESSALDKLIVSVQDSSAKIKELRDKVVNTLSALSEVLGNSGNSSLKVLGQIMFLMDNVSLLTLIIRLLSSNRNVTDWCTFLSENPSLLERELSRDLGAVAVTPSIGEIIVKGPEFTTRIKTCINERTTIDRQVLNQWISDLNRSN